MTESISNCAAYCSPPSTQPRFYNHHGPSTYDPLDPTINVKNNDLDGLEKDNNAIVLKMHPERDEKSPGVTEFLCDNDSINNVSFNNSFQQFPTTSFPTYSVTNNTVVSEALIKKCSTVVHPYNSGSIESSVQEKFLPDDTDSQNSSMSKVNVFVAGRSSAVVCNNTANAITTSPTMHGPMSLPVNVVDRKTEGRVSAIAPKRRTSMLPKPEISPKPSHLTSMSPVRFQTNGYDSPAANKSPTYQFNSINNINMNGKQMSTSLQCQNLKKRSFEFDAHHKRESGSNETSTKSTGTSPPYALGISASCTTISTIDQATRAQGTLNGDNTNHETTVTKDSKLVDKTKGTASMLKSTLKRMSRLSLRSTGGSVGSSPRSLSPFVFKKSTSPTQTNSANDNQQHSSNIPVSNNGTNRRSITSNGNDTAGKGRQANNFYSLNRQNSRKRSGIGTAHLSSAIVSDSYGKPAANNNSSGLQNTQPGASSYCRSLSRSTSNSSSSSNINNIGGQSNGNAHRSNSLKRPSRNKDLAVNQKVSNGTNTLQRSGSSSGTSSASARDVKRSNSMHHHSQRRTFRDRDLNVKYSRGVQTQLTKDAASMDDDNDDASNVNEGGQFPTNIEFSVYFPDLLGSTGCDDVETHVSESTEPVDVRRNRQLQLDNMKLHREIEKYKSAANESDNLKRELRQVRSRLEEEQRSRARIEHELDQHNDKVKLIARSMDSVEQEFEFRDASIQQLETEMRNTKDKATSLEEKLKNANEIITKQNAELSDALSGQQAVLKEYEVAEAEAAELHEFLQSEKITLNEALKESEQEVEDLKNKINSAEERCGQVVRLSEQRNQEILALEAQLEGVEDRAKEMLLSQDSEISQSVTQIAELGSKIEEYLILLYPTKYNSEYSVSNKINTTKDIDCIAPGGNVTFAPKDISSNDDILINGIKSTSDCTNPLPYESNMKDNKLNETVNTMNGINGDVSLQNLSNAIKHRKKISENNSSPGSCSHRSKYSLLSTISKVNNLVKKLFEIGSTEVDKRNVHIGDENKLEVQSQIDETGNFKTINENNQHAEEIAELKAKFLRHKDILKTNYEQAENEVIRLDEIYHDTVGMVLKAFKSAPDIINSNEELMKLKETLELALLEAQQESLSSQPIVNKHNFNSNPNREER